MPSFETIPLELRHKIFSYLLIDHNVTELDSRNVTEHHFYDEDLLDNDEKAELDRCRILLPRFVTSLFYVSKQLSSESIWYFYSQNAFIRIEVPTVCSARFAQFRRCCIMKPVDWADSFSLQNRMNKRFALLMRILYKQHNPSVSRSTAYMVISTNQFSKLVRLMNGDHYGLFCDDPLTKIDITLDLVLEASFFKGNLSVRNKILNSIRLIKGRETYGRKLCFQFKGKFGREVAATAGHQCLKPLNQAAVCDYSREFLNLGNELFRKGFYEEAKGAYTATSEVLAETPFYRNLGFEGIGSPLHTCGFIAEAKHACAADASVRAKPLHPPTTENEMADAQHLTNLENCLQLCHTYSKLRITHGAVSEANRAFYAYRARLMSYEEFCRRIVNALTDDGRLGSIHTCYRSFEKPIYLLSGEPLWYTYYTFLDVEFLVAWPELEYLGFKLSYV